MDPHQFLRDLHDWLFGWLGWPTFRERENLSHERDGYRAGEKVWEDVAIHYKKVSDVMRELSGEYAAERDQHKRDLDAACEVIAKLQSERDELNTKLAVWIRKASDFADRAAAAEEQLDRQEKMFA